MCGCPYMFSYNVTQKAATPDYNPDVTVITAAMTHHSLSLSLPLCLCVQYTLSLPLPLSISLSLCIPLFLSVHSLPCFGLSLSVSLWVGLKSTSRGVCGWGLAATCRSLYWKWVLYFFKRPAGSQRLCVYSFLFSIDESRQGADTTESHHRR